MRGRLEASATHSAAILRYRELDPDDPDVETNAIGEPVDDTSRTADTSLETVLEDVPCQFSDRSTSFVREDSGERVQRPAAATFPGRYADDVQEGDLVDVDGVATRFEVRGIEETIDHRRGVTVSVEAELERSD